MRVPPLLPLLRSQLQGRLLARLYLHPESEHSLTDLAHALGTSVKTVHHEANRLTEAGLLAERRVGNVRLLRADTSHRLAAPLANLLAATYGPEPVLADLLAAVPDVAEAYIYGSWAARFVGRAGRVPADVDVLVVGDASRDDLDGVEAAAQAALMSDVTIHQVSVHSWRAADDDPFLSHVRSGPLVSLTTERDDDAALGAGEADDRTPDRRRSS
ncbi:MAG: winged helix-turn-helix transcriptional regulator [Demequinaceae bacterium]|nr:winged helix-turn-helix transcriptional regulator [Demequinaceae bacterium]